MKKLALLLAFLLFSAPAFASRTFSNELITSTLLDNSPTSVAATTKVKSAEKIGFFVTYDETEVGNSISAAVTAFISWDGVTWLASSFYDFAGGATLQTTETISADGNYYFWLPFEAPVPYVKVNIAGTNTDADDTALVSAKIITTE